MMSRVAWVLVALCALSCNASVSARVVKIPSGAPAPAVVDPYPRPSAPVYTVPLEFIERKPKVSAPPAALLDDSGDVLLCCDRPTGICYQDSGERCTAHTSQLVACPAIAVREFDAAHGFVMCAD